MTRGWGCDGSLRALRNRRLAAAASRNADSRKSMVAPVVPGKGINHLVDSAEVHQSRRCDDVRRRKNFGLVRIVVND
jgi:hypothetical protein